MRTTLALPLLLLSAGAACADPAAEAAVLVETKCSLCHGREGEASSTIYPRLAGQNREYLVKQLRNFRDGTRKSDTMNDMARDLTDGQIEALADYFSARPPRAHRVRDRALAAVGEYIYHHGNRFSGIPACATCHGKHGEGNERLPRLAGQHKRYVADQLRAFDKRVRTNDNAIMHAVASKLTELEIEAVALYVSGLKGEKAENTDP